MKSAKKNSEIDIRLARLLANTKARKRTHPINIVVNDIIWLEKELGSFKEISKRADVSIEMIKRFLSFKYLCTDVQNLVKSRRLDSVEIVNHLKSFNCSSQKIIARDVLYGELNSYDVKTIRAYKKEHPELKINQIIKKIKNIKEKKIYVLNFYISSEKDPKKIRAKLTNVMNKKEIISFEIQNFIGKLKITKKALIKLRKLSKNKNVNLKKYIEDYLI